MRISDWSSDVCSSDLLDREIGVGADRGCCPAPLSCNDPPFLMPAEARLIAVFQILTILLNILWWIIIVQAIMSWLIGFNVINLHNELVRSVWYALEKITDPIYRPIRKIMPDFGPLDQIGRAPV